MSFGKRVIGEKAFAEQQQMIEEGRDHFGPRVIGPVKESIAGTKVQPQHELDFQLALAKVAGGLKPLKELKLAQLEELCDLVGEERKPNTPKPALIAKLEAACKARREPDAIEPTEEDDQPEEDADAPQEPEATEAQSAAVEAGEGSEAGQEEAPPEEA